MHWTEKNRQERNTHSTTNNVEAHTHMAGAVQYVGNSITLSRYTGVKTGMCLRVTKDARKLMTFA